MDAHSGRNGRNCCPTTILPTSDIYQVFISSDIRSIVEICCKFDLYISVWVRASFAENTICRSFSQFVKGERLVIYHHRY